MNFPVENNCHFRDLVSYIRKIEQKLMASLSICMCIEPFIMYAANERTISIDSAKTWRREARQKKKLMLSGQVLGNFNCFLCAIVSQMNSAGNNNRFMITFVLKVR